MTRRVRSPLLHYTVIAGLTVLIMLQILASWRGAAGEPRYAAVAPDFKTFYCAGAATNAGQNPYLVAPFERCSTPPSEPLPSFVQSGVWAAPIPPYDVALFRIVAKIPYPVAALLWLIVCVAALSVTVAAIAEMSGLAPLAVFTVFALPLYYASLFWGQLPPIVVAALACAAWALRRKSYALAGALCVVSLIEPHLGVPVCLAVFAWSPRTRLAIAAGALVLGLVSVATLGLQTNVEYFRTLLPLQSLAEAPATNQYSFTWIAYFFGVPERAAVTLGTVSYLIMTGFGIWLARAAMRTFGDEAFLPFVPVACAVFGGPYVHQTQTGVSLLLGVMLLGLVRRPAPLLWLGVGLQVPFWFVETWLTRPLSLTRLESVASFALVAFIVLPGASTSRRLQAAAVAACAYLVISFALLHAPPTPVRVAATASAYRQQLGPNQRYTAGEWGVHVRSLPALRVSTIPAFAEKLPIWLGLLFVILATLGFVRGGRVSTASPPRDRPALEMPRLP